MVKTMAYDIFKEFKRRRIKELFEGRNRAEYITILDEVLSELNITKSSLGELEVHNPGTSYHLLYLMQSEMGIDFGICQHYKMWVNRVREQRRCRFNAGPIQVNCYGNIKKCEHDKERIEFELGEL